MKKLGILLTLLLFTSVGYGNDLGISMSEQMISKVIHQILYKHFKANGNVIINLDTFDIDTSLVLSEVDSTNAINIIKEISNLGLYDELKPHIRFNTPELIIDISKDIKLNFTKLSNGSIKAFGYIKPEFISFSSHLIEICDGAFDNCHDLDKVKAKKISMIVKSNRAKANFSFVIKKSLNGLKIELKTFDTNFDQILDKEIEIKLSSLEVPTIKLAIDGVGKELNTSRFKDALLSKKNWLSTLILDSVAEYLFKDFSADMTELLNDVYLPDHYEFKRIKKLWSEYLDSTTSSNSSLETLRMQKKDQLLRDPKLKNQEGSSFSDFLKIALKQAFIGYQIEDVISDIHQESFILNPIVFLNHKEMVQDENPVPIILSDFKNSGDASIVLSEALLNNFLKLTFDTDLMKTYLDVVNTEKGVEIKNFKILFRNKKLILITDLSLDLNQVAGQPLSLKEIFSSALIDKTMNKVAAFLERNNNSSVLSFPVEVELTPYFEYSRNIGKKLISFNINGPSLNQSELSNNYTAFSDSLNNFNKANELVRKGIIKKINKLTTKLSKMHMNPEMFFIKENLKFQIDSFKFYDHKVKINFNNVEFMVDQ